MKERRWAVVQFPGSNCDYDVLRVFEKLPGISAHFHWYENPIEKNEYDVIVLPGGFSFGDYLRAGALAKVSQAVQTLPDAIEAGAHVMGICNGFQILLEARLLPGYLQVNQSLRFISETVPLKIHAPIFPWFKSEDVGKIVHYPIAHRFGNYQCNSVDRSDLFPALLYADNPNGSLDSIAGIYRKMGKGSVFALMPHPERASFDELRLNEGKSVFTNALESLSGTGASS